MFFDTNTIFKIAGDQIFQHISTFDQLIWLVNHQKQQNQEKRPNPLDFLMELNKIQ
jgi:hypothetical protein